MVQGSVENEHAELVYDRVGEGPALLMIPGAGGTGHAYRSTARMLADQYTVLTYDRRCAGRSSGNRERPFEMDQQARDAAAVIAANGFKNALVFGNSGGANIALQLAQDHPDVVSGLVVHEPPLACLLPDADVWMAFVEDVHTTFEAKGTSRAMIRFARPAKGVNPLKLMLANRGQRPDLTFFFSKEHVPISRFRPNIDLLTSHRLPTLALAGSASKDAYYARAAPILASELGCRFVTISGNHFSFLLSPAVFVRELRPQLNRLELP